MPIAFRTACLIYGRLKARQISYIFYLISSLDLVEFVAADNPFGSCNSSKSSDP
jgi:hypothetical protein